MRTTKHWFGRAQRTSDPEGHRPPHDYISPSPGTASPEDLKKIDARMPLIPHGAELARAMTNKEAKQ